MGATGPGKYGHTSSLCCASGVDVPLDTSLRFFIFIGLNPNIFFHTIELSSEPLLTFKYLRM